MTFDAFWLPALQIPAGPALPMDVPDQHTGAIRFPALEPAQLRRQVDALLAIGPELRQRPVDSIVNVIDRVARRFLDGRDPVRLLAEELLPGVTGFSREMTRLTLDRMAADWTKDRLDRLLKAEFGNAACLDGLARLPGRAGRAHAIGPRFAFHVFSGNVPGVAVTSMIRTLLLKAPSLGKTARGEPVLAALFGQALAEEDELLGHSVAVTHWKGGDAPLEEVAFKEADVVIAYGSASTMDSLRRRVPPRARFIEHGSRVSLGVVAREALAGPEVAQTTAHDAALAVATFDQQGCVSPHFIFCEEGGALAPRDWVVLLAAAMEAVESALPRGVISSAESAAIQQVRGAAEIGAFAGQDQRVLASAGSTRWTVLYDATGELQLSCLNRLVRVIPVASLDEIPERVGALAGLLQSIGIAGPDDRIDPLAVKLAELGASRVAALAELAWPPPWWHHDGRSPLGELVRWCDREDDP